MSHRERWINYVAAPVNSAASEPTPRFKEKPATFNFTDGENGIPINKRGSG